jgi:hypothetical protein
MASISSLLGPNLGDSKPLNPFIKSWWAKRNTTDFIEMGTTHFIPDKDKSKFAQ